MSRSTGQKRSSVSRHASSEPNAFYQPKQITILCIWCFITAIFTARTVAAIQRTGLVTTAPNVFETAFGTLHMHHWAIVFIALPLLMIAAFATRDGLTFFGIPIANGKTMWGIFMLGISICLGLFVDGIVYMDSSIFFEVNTEVRQPLSMADLYFTLFLGAIWFGTSVLLFTLMYKVWRHSNPRR